MKSEFMTIYGRYRKAAGLTQERAAELLGVIAAALALRYAEGGVRAWN